MRRSGVVLAAAAMAVLALRMGARADDRAVRKALEAEYAKFTKAFLARDTGSIAGSMAPGFVWKRIDGRTLMGKNALEAMKAELAVMPPVKSINLKIGKITVRRNTAVAVSTTDMTIIIPKGQDGKRHRMEAGGTSIETWVKMGAQWKLRKTEDKTMTGKMDGKPIDMRMMQGGPQPPPRR